MSKPLQELVEEVHSMVNGHRRSAGLKPLEFAARSSSTEARVRDPQHRRDLFLLLCPTFRMRLLDLASAIGWPAAAERCGIYYGRLRALTGPKTLRVPTLEELKKVFAAVNETVPEILLHDFSRLKSVRKQKRAKAIDLAQLFCVWPSQIYLLEKGRPDKVDVVSVAEIARWEMEQTHFYGRPAEEIAEQVTRGGGA